LEPDPVAVLRGRDPYHRRHGDLHPTSDGTRLFTIAYIFLGIGVFVALLTSIAQEYVKQRADGHIVAGE
jgi:Ion channel